MRYGPSSASNRTMSEPASVIARLRRYARVLTGNAIRADDLVQDTLVRARAERSPRRAEADPRLALFTIMHDVYVTAREVTVREPAVIRAVADASRAGDAQLVERGNLRQRVELREVEQRLGRLPAGEREVLLLTAVEKLSYDEIASILGTNVGTVLARLSRARDRLTRLAVVPPAAPSATPRMVMEAVS
jgi:RNA polymerase sigma-70 factor, ECF subfamily